MSAVVASIGTSDHRHSPSGSIESGRVEVSTKVTKCHKLTPPLIDLSLALCRIGQMAKKKHNQDWLPALEASQLLAPRVGGLTRAREILAIGLREGMLNAAAESSSISEGDEDEFVEEEAAAHELLGIPAEAWTRSEHWEADRLRWDWDLGEFEIENLDWPCTYMFHGVHFLSAEVEALDPSLSPYSLVDRQGDEGRPTGRRGPKPSIRWGMLIEAILQSERDGDLVKGRFEGPGKLLEHLQRMIPEDRQFEDRSIEPVIAYLYENLIYGR